MKRENPLSKRKSRQAPEAGGTDDLWAGAGEFAAPANHAEADDREKIRAADYVARFLQQMDVRWVFEVSGGMITHLLDANVADKVEVGMELHSGARIPTAADASLVAPELLGQPDVDLNPG